MSKEAKERILEISYERKLSHVGSSLSALPIIEEIYNIKKPEEKFVLSAGHSAIALYVVLEKKGILKDIDKLNVHPDRGEGIDCSTGSLGQGLPIAVGMALADRNRNVYCLISDGECAEGSIWEALRIASEQKLDNLKVYVNSNGWSAYGEIDQDLLERRLKEFFPVNFVRTNSDFGDVKGLDAHYKVPTKEEYERIKKD